MCKLAVVKGSRPQNEATSMFRSESVSSLMLYLQEVFAVWMRDDVKTEALTAGECS